MPKDTDPDPTAKSRADQLRNAVEGAFSATAGGAAPVQKRAQDLADELVGVAARVRALAATTLAPARAASPTCAAEVAALRDGQRRRGACEARVRRAGAAEQP